MNPFCFHQDKICSTKAMTHPCLELGLIIQYFILYVDRILDRHFFFYYTPLQAIPGRENKLLELELELKAVHLVCLYILNHYICCTHSHVWSATSISGFSNGVHKLTADSKVTQLYVSIPVQEDIWGFDVWKKENKSLFIKIKKKILRPNAQEIQDVKTVLYLCVLFSSFLLSGLVLSQSEKRKKISSVKKKKKKSYSRPCIYVKFWTTYS